MNLLSLDSSVFIVGVSASYGRRYEHPDGAVRIGSNKIGGVPGQIGALPLQITAR